MGVSLGRYIVLVLPPPAADESHQLAHRRAGAILVTLDAASTFGLTIGGERLQAPVGEGIVVVGHPDHMQPSLQRQVRESAEILRVLADQGPLGDEVRARLRQRAGSEPGRGQIFQLIGVASIVFDPAPIAALLAQLALDMDARARALRTPREGTA